MVTSKGSASSFYKVGLIGAVLVGSLLVGQIVARQSSSSVLMLALLPLFGLLFLKPYLSVMLLPLTAALPRGDYLPFGVNPTLIVLGLASFSLGVQYALRRLPKSTLHPVTGLLAGLFGVALFHAVFGMPDAKIFFINFGPALPAFIIGQLLIDDEQALRRLALGIEMSGILLLGGVLYVTFFGQWQQKQIAEQQFLLLRGWGFNPYGGSGNWLAVAIFPLTFAFVRVIKGAVWNFRTMVAYATIGSTFLLSTLYNARAGWFLCGLGVLFALRVRERSERRTIWRSLVIILALIGTIFLALQFSPAGALASMSARAAEIGSFNNFLDRLPIWPSALQLIVARPLLGWGPGEVTPYYGHNAYLDAALNYGIPFALVFTTATVSVMICARRAVAWLVLPSTQLILMALRIGIVLSILFNLAVPAFLGDAFFCTVFWLCAGGICKSRLEKEAP